MKKIAIVLTNMIVGGTGKCVVEMLKKVDHINYDWTLFTWDENMAFAESIPTYVEVRYLKDGANTYKKIVDDLKNYRINSVISNIFYRLGIRFVKDAYLRQVFSEKSRISIKEEFDCAIAYNLNWIETSCVCFRINAKRKAAFLHNMLYRDDSSFYSSLDKIEKIFCVSKGVKAGLVNVAPHLADKLDVMHNCYDCDEIQKKAEEKISDVDFSHTNLVSVGRIGPDKGHTMVPDVCRMLLDSGYKIKWYLVGDGKEREKVEREIKKNNVEDHVILLGTKMNPYPYIKNCTIFVQPSLSEGYCTTTMEAKILHKPVVTTDVSGMREQFVSGEDGLIVDVSVDGLYRGIKELLDHPEMRERFIKKLKTEKLDNSDELQKLYDFIEGE